MVEKNDGLLAEYAEINQHLRSNSSQFVNWFSFFLMASFLGFGVFVFFRGRWPTLGGIGLENTVTLVSMVMHALAGAAILTFRFYISASNARVEAVLRQTGVGGVSPVPLRFCKWMTNFMAAGYVISYFTWFTLLFTH
jgi:hypothetical protein